MNIYLGILLLMFYGDWGLQFVFTFWLYCPSYIDIRESFLAGEKDQTASVGQDTFQID